MLVFDEKLIVPKDYAEVLPKKFVRYIAEQGQIVQVDGDYIEVTFSPPGRADEIWDEFRTYEKNAYRSDHRKFLMSMSGGMYEQSDIEAIFDMQGGLCYFSGEPLVESPKNYSLDHLKPVRSGGSCWPSNLALVLKVVNQEKHGRSATSYWKLLAKRHGQEWIEKRKQICREIDVKRRKLSEKRKNIFKRHIAELSTQLKNYFEKNHIELEFYSDDQLSLCIDGVEVIFPKGVVRDRAKICDVRYLKKVIEGIL